MSGIFGLLQLTGAPASADDLGRMGHLLRCRGPEGTESWLEGTAGLGHTRLATTPESLFERLPLRHRASGCVITADVRLDNRDELLAGMGISDRAGATGDAEIILLAYLAWGESCVERFLGDFAFAIWDPRRRSLFCARDQLGMKPFNYYHRAGELFAFASSPQAILALEQVPHRINEGRIADYLVTQLEGIDKTSTFFEDIFRLPPAHRLTATPQGLAIRRYWAPEPGPELRLPSDAAYAEAFLDLFTEAVRCRLRAPPGSIGSTLSGGMDSGSTVALASTLLAIDGRGPFPTFSGVSPDPDTCIETRTIRIAQGMAGLEPHTVHYGQLDGYMPELEELTWDPEEPFDNSMTLLRVLYLEAKRRGCKVVLDGAGGDAVLAEGSYLARLLKAGRWLTAWREAKGQERFWGGGYPAWREIRLGARSAFIPDAVKRMNHRLRGGGYMNRRAAENVNRSMIRRDFATQVGLADRLRRLDENSTVGLSASYGTERARAIDHPYLAVGRERFDRVAASIGIEPRDPFLDRRVVSFCLSLPGGQRLGGGWPKVILRRAMEGRLPDQVRWRRGKEHLGASFTLTLAQAMRDRLCREIEVGRALAEPYVDVDTIDYAFTAVFSGVDHGQARKVYDFAQLCGWLSRHAGHGMVSRPLTV